MVDAVVDGGDIAVDQGDIERGNGACLFDDELPLSRRGAEARFHPHGQGRIRRHVGKKALAAVCPPVDGDLAPLGHAELQGAQLGVRGQKCVAGVAVLKERDALVARRGLHHEGDALPSIPQVLHGAKAQHRQHHQRCRTNHDQISFCCFIHHKTRYRVNFIHNYCITFIELCQSIMKIG